MIATVAHFASTAAAISHSPHPAIATTDGQPSIRSPGVSLVEGRA